jgi:hypothetical protein
MLPLSANIVYPTLAVVDCRAENISTGRLFRTLRLVQLNTILCSDLSERECAYNEGTIDETDPEKVPLPSTLRCACVVVVYSSCSGSSSAAVRVLHPQLERSALCDTSHAAQYWCPAHVV